jgi:phospholipid/cholesterol/gamma-HCH transport system substrate-binding protein
MMASSTKSGFSKFIERARSEPGLGGNILAYLGLVAVGLFAAGYFLTHERFNPPWENRYSIFATFDESPGVSPGKGQEVRIAGIEVGDIRSQTVQRNGKARLELSIDDDQKVYSNARFVLRPKSPLNDMYIEINPGGPPGRPLTDGSSVPVANTVRPIQVDEVLAHLDDNAQAAITSLLSEADVALANAPADLPKGLVATDATVAELQPVMEQLETRRQLLANLVTSLSQIAGAVGDDDERLTRLASSLQETLSTIGGRDNDLDEALAELPEFSTQLRHASTDVNDLVKELDPTLRRLGHVHKDLPKALSKLDDSVDELDDFIQQARPTLRHAKPVLSDLKSAGPHLVNVTADLRPISKDLDPLTKTTVPNLDNLNGFFYNTNSTFSLHDANRGILRGLFGIATNSIPPDILKQLTDLGSLTKSASKSTSPETSSAKKSDGDQ